MKVPKRISYSKDVDILMIQLSNKKVDDSYDTDDMIVQVDENGKPVIIEIFNGKKYLKELNKDLPKNLQNQYKPDVAILHQIKNPRRG